MGMDTGRRHRLALWLAIAAALPLAGCGGGGGGSDTGHDPRLSLWQQRTEESDKIAAVCAQPRSGRDPYNDNQPYPDKQGSINDEKKWVNTYMHEVYLWYQEIPSVSASPYTVARYGSVTDALDAYFRALKTPQMVGDKRKDQFSFTYPTDQWNALSQGGITIGYGMQIAFLANQPPRKAVIAYSDPGTPASGASVARGAEILKIDGVDLVNDDTQDGVDTLNAGLSPDSAGESHTFTLRDAGSSGSRDVYLTAQQVTSTPVQNLHTIDTGSGRVGYLQFNDHIATAEGQLINAVTQLRDAGISDLVLDMRYNGGGYLDIASELAYMVAGDARTSGKVFETLGFNDKNPLAQADDLATPFHAAAMGFDPSVTEGAALPQLGLSRVFVLAGAGTCSASESVINGLRGIDVGVVLIGDATCGKPYGFYPQDNCGLSYFAIEFEGVNQKGFGDYANGFTPDCSVADDFSHALGDANEALLATALQYRTSGSCAVSARSAAIAEPMQLLRSPLRENRFVNKPR
jgi:carboxyl-terminal processing protease